MKLDRLASTTPPSTREPVEHARPLADERIRRVAAGEGVVADRERSLQQEMAEIEPEALADFKGNERIMQDAKALAAQLVSSETSIHSLINPEHLTGLRHAVDDAA